MIIECSCENKILAQSLRCPVAIDCWPAHFGVDIPVAESQGQALDPGEERAEDHPPCVFE
ncbi:hypothetical protein TMatcc_003150 [Talaromyces marneffei ATCC 18224]